MAKQIFVTHGWYNGLKSGTQASLERACDKVAVVEHLPDRIQLMICKKKLNRTATGGYLIRVGRRGSITLPASAIL